MELRMDFDSMMRIRRDRAMFYSEDDSKFTFYINIETFVIITEITKEELKKRKISLLAFRTNMGLDSNVLRVNSEQIKQEMPEVKISIKDEMQEIINTLNRAKSITKQTKPDSGVMSFDVGFDNLIRLRNFGDRVMLYSEDEKGFTFWMSVDNFILTSRVTLEDLKERNTDPVTFRNNLTRCFKVNYNPEAEHAHDAEYLGEKLDGNMILADYLDSLDREKEKHMEGIRKGFVGWDFSDINEYMIEFLKRYNFPLITGINDKQRKEIKKLFMEVLLKRLTIAQLEERLDKVLGDESTPQRVEMIVRTETIKISAESSLDRYKSMGIKKVRWLATIASQRTCEICLGYHNRVFTIEEARNMIPDKTHPQCRCSWLPII